MSTAHDATIAKLIIARHAVQGALATGGRVQAARRAQERRRRIIRARGAKKGKRHG